MAQLPTAAALGETPTPQPNASVATARTGFEAQATAELGGAIEEIAQRIQKARRGAQLADALGRAQSDLETKALEYQRDQDFKTSGTRFAKDATSIGETYAKTIDDPVTRDLFSREYTQKSLVRRLEVIKAAAKQEQDYNVAAMDQREDLYVRQAVASPEGLMRESVLNEARADLAVMRKAGWLTDVDAAKRERSILSKVDQAIATRDLSDNPIEASRRLALEPTYAPNLDPVTRERLVDAGFRRADAERARAERDQDKERRKQAEDIMLQAFDLEAKGQLTRGFVDKARALVTPSEYRGLLKALEGGAQKDDPAAYARLQKLSYDDPKEAERLAFAYHKSGQIKNETLAAVLSRARGIDRQEGPRTEYERSRRYVTDSLEPSAQVPDPAPRARQALAVREYDDFAASGKRTDQELRDKSNEVVKRMALVNMTDLAQKTSVGARSDPKTQLEELAKRGEKLKADLDAERISPSKFNQEMAKLNTARKAAEAAMRLH
jgi:hypothetical protein